MQLLKIPGELADLNTFIDSLKASRWGGQKIKNVETERVAWLAKVQKIAPVQNYPVQIKYVWYMKDRRKDIDNVAFAKKYINDGLVQAGVLENDGQKQIDGFSDEFFIDKDNPRIEIHIVEKE